MNKMVKKCVYCSVDIANSCVVDMCERCMYGVWGEKMTKTIIENMERERDVGNLELGQVGVIKEEIKETKKSITEIPNRHDGSTPEINAEELIIDEVS